jgi:hypothetical protein
LMNSRITSCTNDIGASVLIDPAAACERDTLYPALSSAELRGVSAGVADGKGCTYTYSVRLGHDERKKLAIFEGVK